MGKDSESVDTTRATLHKPINVYEELARQKSVCKGSISFQVFAFSKHR